MNQKNRSGIKEGFKGKNEVTNWLIKAESWTIESNCLSPVEAKCMIVESKRKSPSLEVTNWPAEAKCLTIILLSYISVIRE